MKFSRPVLLALLISTCVPVATHAEKAPARPKPPKVLITLTDGAQNGGKLLVPVTTSFAPPKGTTTAQACKGKIKLSAPIGKKTVKRKGKKVKVTLLAKKTARIKTVEGRCVATATLSLPVSLTGKKLKFTAKSKGNSAVKAFKKTARLVVSVPPAQPSPPPARIDPVKGAWIASGKDAKGAMQQWTFTVLADGSVASIGRGTPLNVSCPGIPEGFNVALGKPLFDSPFSMTYVDTTASDNDAQDQQNIDQVFKFHFDGPSHATGSFQLTGSVRGPMPALDASVVYTGCDSGVIAIEARPGIFA